MSTIADFVQAGSDPPLPLPTSDDLWHMSLETYHEMIRQGILTDDDPVELWEGVLVQKMPKNRAHCLATELVRDALANRLAEDWHAESQVSVAILNSEPEPDVIVVRGAKRDYVDQNPSAADLGLVVEVAEATLGRDRGFKKALYAKAGVPIYWIVNLIDRQVEVYTEPGTSGNKTDYLARHDYRAEDVVPFVLAGHDLLQIPAREMLP